MLSGLPRRRVISAVASLVAAALVVCGCSGGTVASVESAPDPGLDSGVVHTRDGQLRGLVASDHLLFQGIPYAAPPEGALRWQPPAPVQPWSGIRDASKPGARCVQDSTKDPGWGRQTVEDCLLLNVWAPRGAADKPVMVWIHGGAFINGSGELYDAHQLASRGDIVVVTVNYRLGAPGFLAHPALGPPGEVGNYGLADQQAALRWVRDNIADFGGDPDKVTVAGESAGGMSVCDHLTAPGSEGLFRAAIIQSGPCQAQAPLASAQRDSERYAESVGCADPATAAQCLRALPATKLEQPPWFYKIGDAAMPGPVTGSSVLPEDPMTAIRDGRAARVPVLIGTNRDEFTLFTATEYLKHGREMTAQEYPRALDETFGARARAVEQRYPPAAYGGSVSLAWSAAITDSAFACVADRLAVDLSRGGPVFAYEFNDRAAPAPDPLRQLPFPVGASHSLELRYLFDVAGAPPLDTAQQRLSEQMIDYWAQFVATGVPTAPGAPAWPEIEGKAGAGPWMSLQPDGSRMVSDFAQAHQCAFWAAD